MRQSEAHWAAHGELKSLCRIYRNLKTRPYAMIVLLEIVISIFLRWTWRAWASGPSVDSSPNGVKRMPQLFESVIIYKNGSLNTKHDIFSGSLPQFDPYWYSYLHQNRQQLGSSSPALHRLAWAEARMRKERSTMCAPFTICPRLF